MIATIHRLTISISTLHQEDVASICDLLGLPLTAWQPIKYNNSVSYKYSFLNSPDHESAYFQCGTADEHGLYHYPRLTLHGSFFDNSPSFNAFQFLQAVKGRSRTVSIKELDVCHIEQEASATITFRQWVQWANEYKLFLAGDMLRRSKVWVDYESGEPDNIKLGKASSSSAYGTIYRRDGMIRLEVKYRKNLSCISELLMESEEQFQYRAAEELTRQLFVCKEGTAHTKKPEMHPKYKKYIAFTPSRKTLKAIKEEAANSRATSDTSKKVSASKRVAGYLNNYVARYPDAMHELVEQLTPQALEELKRCFFDF